jgi:hypothetical protein
MVLDYLLKLCNFGSTKFCKAFNIILLVVFLVLQILALAFWGAYSQVDYGGDCDAENYIRFNDDRDDPIESPSNYEDDMLDLCASDGSIIALVNIFVAFVFVVTAICLIVMH